MASNDEFSEIPYDLVKEAPRSVSARSVHGEHSERSEAHSTTSLTHTLMNGVTSFMPLGSSSWDSLYLYYCGELRSDSRAELDSLRTLARDFKEISNAQKQIESHIFRVSPNGRNKLLYSLLGDYLEIDVGNKANDHAKIVAKVKIKTLWLATSSIIEIEKEVRELLSKLCYLSDAHKVHRADLKQDFCCDDNLIRQMNVRAIYSSSRIRPYLEVGGICSGFDVALKSPTMSSRLYDKSLHLTLTEMEAMREPNKKIWAHYGWDGERNVWRYELELKRPCLKSFGINTVEQLESQKESLWKQLGYDFCKIVIPNLNDSNRARWPVHPLWVAIIAAGLSNSTPPKIKRMRPDYTPKRDRSIKRSLSAFATVCAIDGVSSGYINYIENALGTFLMDGIFDNGTSVMTWFDEHVAKQRQKNNFGLNDPRLFKTHKSWKSNPASETL